MINITDVTDFLWGAGILTGVGLILYAMMLWPIFMQIVLGGMLIMFLVGVCLILGRIWRST